MRLRPGPAVKVFAVSFSSLLAVWILVAKWSSLPSTKVVPLVASLGSSKAHHDHFRWSEITPNEKLIYTPCYGGFQCARLEVPMDWNRTEKRDLKVAIAIVRLPARVPITDHRYGGPILLNSGGPGVSTVKQTLDLGRETQLIVDSSIHPSDPSATAKYYDILGFDPRGVNNTTPHLKCFPDSLSRRKFNDGIGSELLSTSPEAYSRLWTSLKNFSSSCADESSRADGIGKYMNTAPVVRDMLEIVERHGSWREEEALALLFNDESVPAQKEEMRNVNSHTSILERTKWRKGAEKLQYWGFSYGTVLGSTFAAIHPHRVSRMLLDGVVDVPKYYRTEWSSSLEKADLLLDKFSEYCFQAGAEKCKFFAGNSEKDIKNSFQKLFAGLKEKSIAIPNSVTRVSVNITWSDAKLLVFNALYSPITKFNETATLLADLRDGKGLKFAEYKLKKQKIPSRSTSEFADELEPGENEDEVCTAILCSDGEDITGRTQEEFQAHYKKLSTESVLMGDIWAQIPLRCIGWRSRPAWRFKGPIAGGTLHPILFIGNTLDIATPLASAHLMSKSFNGSVVLEQDSAGHCSLSSPSLCTAKTIRKYFQDGGLPEMGKRCGVDQKPFLGWVGGRDDELPAEEKELKATLQRLVEKW